MSIIVNSEDPNNISQLFDIEKDWLIGRTILSNNNFNPFNYIFDYSENNKDLDDHSRLQQVEHIHTLSQQVIQRPNRTCLSDIYNTNNVPIRIGNRTLYSIIPSQNTLFELAQNKPDNSRWTLTFQEDEIFSDVDGDDGFQSASSSLSEDKSKLALVPIDETDHWFRALTQAENKYFTWEQRGSYIYDRMPPYLFDLRKDDRPFQHMCLLLLFNKPSLSYSIADINYRPIAVDEFLRDLCYMLMGISSQTFEWNEIHQTFELEPDVYVLGYTQITIEQFSLKYIQAGNNFYLIKQYINHASKNSETENEFCQALRCYLRYIQKSIAIYDISKYSLVKFAAQVDPILCSLDLPLSLISTIKELEQTIHTSSPNTSIAFVKLSSILHTLLNHNYHNIDHNYFLLLIHFVIYTIRPILVFLTDLMIHSNYLDRYNEYPILFNYNRLIGLKTNDFWTKTFTIRYLHANNRDTIFHQILPIEYLQQIVNITRSLMLIKLCDKNHPLCSLTTNIIPQLNFIYINSLDNIDRKQIYKYQEEMNEKIFEYEQAQKQKRLEIEQAKIQERMDMYARQDQQRAERKKLADDEKQRLLKEKKILRDHWQEQIDKKQQQLKEEKLAQTIADTEFNKVTSTTTIIGTRLATPYANLVENVRDEIISEYDAKMRDANEREEQFRNRIQSNITTDTPTEIQSSLSSTSSPSFHTPAIDQSPSIVSSVDNQSIIVSPSPTIIEKPNNIETLNLISKEEVQLVSKSIEKPIIRHTATEETTQDEYRRVVKFVPSNVLKSTIQNYMIDHNPLDENQEEEELPEKIYDWDAIIANGPQFKYDDSFDFKVNEKDSQTLKENFAESWFNFDMSPLRVWLEHSISPLIHVQSQLVNCALLNYFFDELKLLYHLNNLRSYYFLATGRFGLAFCSELSQLLLTNDDARIIYRVNSMRQILYTSLDQAGELDNLIDILQLTAKINIPNSISLLDSTLLDYFDLNYTIQWPLNIVISQDMLEKYKIIFRFLLRILIVKQVLNEIWIILKSCKQQNSTLSKLHQYRHQMQHFMTVLISYITNQVIQIAWTEFMHKIQKAKHINEIAAAHNEYLDRTMLNCLLTPNAAPILNEVNRVLTLIIRFRCQLKTFSWILNANYTDPSDTSVQALRTTFEKYHIAVLSLFKVLSKLVEKGYKTSLSDLLIRLNHNGYYDQITTFSTR
ncbi:unnamed protein product [Rotaria sordida]|uniref:Gamma tubulin complex component C-terminal domain-containing protein n=1 Tax=Rotaria sordida TaxID=392033 RepID=A0A814XLX2_9BILA|nr:unnamed protein product [Rotaria sordida]